MRAKNVSRELYEAEKSRADLYQTVLPLVYDDRSYLHSKFTVDEERHEVRLYWQSKRRPGTLRMDGGIIVHIRKDSEQAWCMPVMDVRLFDEWRTMVNAMVWDNRSYVLLMREAATKFQAELKAKLELK